MAEVKKAAPTATERILGLLGAIAFLAGLIIAVVGGAVSPDSGVLLLVLVILGVIVGFLNITAKEMVPFLIAAIALIALGSAGFKPLDNVINGLGTVLDDMVAYIGAFIAPAALINAIRVVIAAARPG